MAVCMTFWCALAAVAGMVVFTSPAIAQPSVTGCSADSAAATRFRMRLEDLYRDRPATRFSWSRDARICEAAARADAASKLGRGSDAHIVYAMRGEKDLTYAVVTPQPAGAEGSGEWSAYVCFYDRRWRQRGICVAL